MHSDASNDLERIDKKQKLIFYTGLIDDDRIAFSALVHCFGHIDSWLSLDSQAEL